MKQFNIAFSSIVFIFSFLLFPKYDLQSSPTLISPSNNASSVSVEPTLIWDLIHKEFAGCMGGDSYYYEIEISQYGISIEHQYTYNTTYVLNSILHSDETYDWRVRAWKVDCGTPSDWSSIWHFTTTSGDRPFLHGINNSFIPESFTLLQNYPNPFNPVTNIKFSIPRSSFVKINVFDITGKEVTKLVNENMNAGSYTVDFNASDLATGVYLYRIDADGFTDVKKMMLIK